MVEFEPGFFELLLTYLPVSITYLTYLNQLRYRQKGR